MRKQETMLKELLKKTKNIYRDNDDVYLLCSYYIIKTTDKAINDIYGDISKYISDAPTSVELNGKEYNTIIKIHSDYKDFCKDFFESDVIKLVKEYKVKRNLTEREWLELFNYNPNYDIKPVYLNPEHNIGFSVSFLKDVLNLICTDTNEVTVYAPYMTDKVKRENSFVNIMYTDHNENTIEAVLLGCGKRF